MTGSFQILELATAHGPEKPQITNATSTSGIDKKVMSIYITSARLPTVSRSMGTSMGRRPICDWPCVTCMKNRSALIVKS
jgi:hypothetical protein